MPYQNVIDRLLSIRPGEKVVYFQGFLLSELENKSPTGPAAVARIAYRLAVEGKVILTQKRISPPLAGGVVNWKYGHGGGFEYIATGAHPTRRKQLAPLPIFKEK